MKRLLLAAAVMGLSFYACAHTETTEVKTTPKVEVAAAPEDAGVSTGPKSCTSDGECGDAQLCIRNVCVDISKGLAECRSFRVHFGFNSTDFEAEDKSDLTRMARCLRADQKLSVTIEGNADERGTEEYNLQLGSKRASTVEKYLVALGVTPTQVKTISYGENKPICTEKDEACWAKNRRAAVKPSNEEGKDVPEPAGKPAKPAKKK